MGIQEVLLDLCLTYLSLSLPTPPPSINRTGPSAPFYCVVVILLLNKLCVSCAESI
jgi:hypothetical protein